MVFLSDGPCRGDVPILVALFDPNEAVPLRNAVVDAYTKLGYRVETVPAEQAAAGEDRLVRVARSRSVTAPRAEYFGGSFLFLTREDERFRDTKTRLLDAAGASGAEATLGLTSEVAVFGGVQSLGDDDVLSEFVDVDRTTLYVFGPGAAQGLFRRPKPTGTRFYS